MRISGLFISFLFLSACQSDKEKLLVGRWNAAQMVECEEVVPINTSLVNLEFRKNGTYVFNSTLNVHEEGKYRLAHDYLYTQDKIKTNAPEKAVFIKAISSDSLVLQMSFKGKDQWLTLMREGVTIMNDNTIELKDIVEQKKQEMDSFYAENKLITENKDQLNNLAKMPTSSTPNTEGGANVAGAVAAGKILTDALKPKIEEKKVDKTPEKQFDTKAEAYAKREALRKREEAKQKEDERRRYENYMDRERDRKREEAKRKAAKKK
jgi:hypothetical protein